MIKTDFNRMHIALGIVTLAAALSTGCASSSPEQAKVKQLATSVEDISRQWKQGNDLVVSGEKAKSKGGELVAEGRKQISEGEHLISRGKTLMAESENAFRDTSMKASGPVSFAK